MKPCLTVNVNLETCKALYTPSVYNAAKYGLSTEAPTEVDVFGLFQVADGNDVDAYFVVKLHDGRCCYAGVTEIQFIQEVDEQ